MKLLKTLSRLSGCVALLATANMMAAEAANFDAEAKYQATCFACHGTGAAHSPEVGDVIEWEIRLEKGLDTLVQNTIDGLNGIMPRRGLCADCSDEDLRAIVEYMLESSK
ncbi:MAG: cytochrome c5 family protein [Proteobacteria bacterium]|nr:cytochrome c5 family protein [Pseudomonadota bacterium]